jgi:hypothetical protein
MHQTAGTKQLTASETHDDDDTTAGNTTEQERGNGRWEMHGG